MKRSLVLRPHASPDQVAYEDRLEEALARLTMQVTDEITWQMRSLGLSRADLAARMGVSPGRVSQVLSGGENITLRTLAGMAAAVDGHFEVQLHLEGSDRATSQPRPMDPPAALADSKPQELARALSARSGARPGARDGGAE
jgi:transcriptional regulator with XRE-family HTH domain